MHFLRGCICSTTTTGVGGEDWCERLVWAQLRKVLGSEPLELGWSCSALYLALADVGIQVNWYRSKNFKTIYKALCISVEGENISAFCQKNLLITGSSSCPWLCGHQKIGLAFAVHQPRQKVAKFLYHALSPCSSSTLPDWVWVGYQVSSSWRGVEIQLRGRLPKSPKMVFKSVLLKEFYWCESELRIQRICEE